MYSLSIRGGELQHHTTTNNINSTPSNAMPQSRKRRSRAPKWLRADDLIAEADATSTSEPESSADEAINLTGNASAQSLPRGMNMNAYAQQQPSSRQASRLQNTQKTAVGNGGWGSGGFGMICGGAAGGAAGGSGGGNVGGSGFGAGAPGLGSVQPRPQQLSGFAQVMGGGGQQGPIDMR